MSANNNATFVGRISCEPTSSSVNGKTKSFFRVAVDRYDFKNKKKIADFFPVTLWGATAENFKKYAKKGRLISISGEVTLNTYDSKDGTHHKDEVLITANDFKWLDSAKSSESFEAEDASTKFENAVNNSSSNDSDIPF